MAQKNHPPRISSKPSNPHIVVIGGGTGSFSVLTGLKRYTKNLTAIVNMSDDGGSSGILRDELGALPPGDVRQCLVALSESDQIMRDLFNYRFAEGTFSGHSFGNLFLSALEKTTGNFAQAVKTAGEVLKIRGQVVPATYDDIRLHLRLPDGRLIEGEDTIGEKCAGQNFFQKGFRPDLYLEPQANLSTEAATAISAADLIVIAPGKLYSSIGPTLLINGMRQALQASPAKKVYICNLMTLAGQTDNFSTTDHVTALEALAGGSFIDYVIANTAKPGPELLQHYASYQGTLINFNATDFASTSYRAIGAPLFSNKLHRPQAGDILPRTLIRHDPDKVAAAVMKLYEQL